MVLMVAAMVKDLGVVATSLFQGVGHLRELW